MNPDFVLNRNHSPSMAERAKADLSRRFMYATRQRTARAETTDSTSAGVAVHLSSDDGALNYALRATGARLFIQRTHFSGAGTLAVQCLLIAGREDFQRWCAVEPTRFDYPILFDRLRRCGDDAFERIE